MMGIECMNKESGGKKLIPNPLAPCDHKGTIVYIETSLMSDMTMETLAECSKCKKQLIIKGEKFTPINEGTYQYAGIKE